MRSPLKPILAAVVLSLSLSAWAKDPAPAEVKRDSLHQLQDLRDANVKRLRELDMALSKKIDDTKNDNIEQDVKTLQAEKDEHQLRQEFLDRLIFQIDMKYTTGDLRTFLEHALLDMAKVDATSDTKNGSGLWKFLKYAADAIHRLPEQKENVLAFLEGYMNSSVSNPILPEQYLATRNYTNGSKSESGRPVDREDVGAIADRRLHQIGADKDLKSE